MKTELTLFPATTNDFTYYELDELKRKIGMPYILINSKGELDLYHVTQYTNPHDLARFIKEGRCYILKRESVPMNQGIKPYYLAKKTLRINRHSTSIRSKKVNRQFKIRNDGNTTDVHGFNRRKGNF